MSEPWMEFLAPSAIISVLIFQFTYFATRKELMKLELRLKELEHQHQYVSNKLTEISTKIDLLLNGRYASRKET